MKNATLKSALWGLALLSMVASLATHAITDKQRAEIEERIKPHGQVCLQGDDSCGNVSAAAPAGSTAAKDPKAIYDQYCTACHTAGIAGAPRLGQATDWEPRLAAGMEQVYAHAINGLNAMPPKGTCMSCSDEEIQATVDYMIEEQQ